MRRREFVAGLGVAGFPARGQERTLPLIKLLHGETPEATRCFLRTIQQGLAASNYVRVWERQ